MKNVVNLLILLVSIVLSACSRSVTYSDFRSINPLGWDKEDTVCFDFTVPDTAVAYNILLHIRHADNYPYQNMWLFVDVFYPDSVHHTDTLEFFLADDRGQWLGRGSNGHIRMPVLYENHLQFSDTGQCRIAVRQGMRSDCLRGVTQLGIELEALNR